MQQSDPDSTRQKKSDPILQKNQMNTLLKCRRSLSFSLFICDRFYLHNLESETVNTQAGKQKKMPPRHNDFPPHPLVLCSYLPNYQGHFDEV